MSEQDAGIERSISKVEGITEKTGHYLVELFQFVALFVIGATIVWSAITAYISMAVAGSATVEDILLLFIYLELGAMVGIYFKTNRLPVQFLIYVAITVMTRSLASSLSIHDMTDMRIVTIAGAIFVLTGAVWVLRHASSAFPPFISHTESDDQAKGR